MKKLDLLLMTVSVLILTSCVTTKLDTTTIPLKHIEPVKNEFTFTASYDDIWNACIAFFAENNVGIDKFDKASGFISSPDTRFVSTVEDDNGDYVNPEADIVIPRLAYFKKDGTGLRASARWNVLVRKIDDKHCNVSINLGNPLTEAYLYSGYNSLYQPNLRWTEYRCNSKSTGHFEKFMFDQISDRLPKE